LLLLRNIAHVMIASALECLSIFDVNSHNPRIGKNYAATAQRRHTHCQFCLTFQLAELPVGRAVF